MQALLITAYKNEKQLMDLLSSAYKNFAVYVHIDKKSTISLRNIQAVFSGIKIIKRYKVNWGGLNHLKAILELLKMAVRDENEYFHIISGQDILVKKPADFDYFRNSGKIYMNFYSRDEVSDDVSRRLRYWIVSANSSMRNPYQGKVNRIVNHIQDAFHIYRNSIGDFKEVYKGVVWCSFPLDAAKYVMDYYERNKMLKEFKHIHIPEEFFFQTVWGNSVYKDRIVPNNMRYTDWHLRNGSNPAVLDETDYQKITASGSFFARKIDPEISKKLMEMIAVDRLPSGKNMLS